MKTLRIVAVCTLVSAGMIVTARQARAIAVPDTGSTCSPGTGGGGCFKINNQNTTVTAGTSSAIGTAITAQSTGSGTAVKGFTDGGTNSIGVFGVATGNGTAVKASSASGNALWGSTTSGTGAVGSSGSGIGVLGSSAGVGPGVYGAVAGEGTAVSGMTQGVTAAARGVYGSALNGVGVYGATTGSTPTAGAAGVYGTSGNGYGVYGSTTKTNGTAVRGEDLNGFGVGVSGSSTNGWGVFGGSNVVGVKGESDGAGGMALVAEAYGAGGIGVYSAPPTTSDMAFYGTGGIKLTGSFAEKVGGGSWSAPSDARIKKDVKDLDRGLAELMRVRPVSFKYNGLGGTEDDGKEYVGVVAQELEKVVPSMVSSRNGKLHKGDAQDTKIEIVDPSAFTYLLINAVKQQQRTIDKQEARLTELERRSAPVAASVIPGGLGAWAALALLPIGLIIGRRQRQRNR